MSAQWYDPDQLPKFDRPPVAETAQAIEYAPVPGLDLYRLMRMQDAWANDYPAISDVPGTPPTPLESTGPEIVMLNEVPKRIWAQAPSNGQLVQTQADRLILNWRREHSDAPYPGYFGRLRDEYSRLWGLAKEWLDAAGLPEPIPLLSEFTYINAVPLGDGEEAEDVLTIVRNPPSELPGKQRLTRFQTGRDVASSGDDPFTVQVHVVGETQTRPGGDRFLVFQVISRAILGAMPADPLAGMDAAHALGSHTFARIVTEAKQAEWGRRA